MDTVIFTLYNYASNQREEYLLLKLFRTALEEEIKWEINPQSSFSCPALSLCSSLEFSAYVQCAVLSICVSSKVDQIQDIVTGNPTVIKMVVSFNRGARGQNTLRQLLAPVVKDIIDDKNLNINTNPVDIYKAWVNQVETTTGEAR